MPTRCKRQGNRGEQAQKQRVEPLRRQRLVAHILHRPNLLDGLLGIEGADGGGGCLREREGRN